MKKPAKFKVHETVKSKLELDMLLDILSIRDEGSYWSYKVLDTYGKEHRIHESMLLKYKNE